MKAEDWVSTENGFKLRKPAKNQDTANTDDQKAATAALPDEEMPSETDGSQEIRQNHLKQQWLKQIQQL